MLSVSKVEELINLIDGRWDVELIRSLFWPVDVHRILQIPIYSDGRIWWPGISIAMDYSQSNQHISVNGHPNSGLGLLHHWQEGLARIHCGRNSESFPFLAR